MRVRWGKRHYEQGKYQWMFLVINCLAILKKGINKMIFLKEIQNAVTILLTLGWQKKQLIGELRRKIFWLLITLH